MKRLMLGREFHVMTQSPDLVSGLDSLFGSVFDSGFVSDFDDDDDDDDA